MPPDLVSVPEEEWQAAVRRFEVANRIDAIGHPQIITNPFVEAALQRPAQEVCHIGVFQVQACVAASCK
jgi:hypothetical protein